LNKEQSKRDCLEGFARGRGERKGYTGAKRIKVCFIYTYEDNIMKPTKHCLKKVWGEGNIMEGEKE
jgi:hypothetical protein